MMSFQFRYIRRPNVCQGRLLSCRTTARHSKFEIAAFVLDTVLPYLTFYRHGNASLTKPRGLPLRHVRYEVTGSQI